MSNSINASILLGLLSAIGKLWKKAIKKISAEDTFLIPYTFLD